MKNIVKMVSKSTADTEEIAKTLAKIVQVGDVITLEGDLGVGKTAFTKGLAQGLNIEERVTSPTFTIVKEYAGTLPLYHMDVYRLEHSEEDLGFDEYFYGDGVTVIEWAQFIADFLPEQYLAITLERTGETSRELTFEAVGSEYERHIEQLRELLGRFLQ
jgi:tRNA threonylcarbamoyladenosine biosynthesis protein TsaE